ncbi:MAG: MBL fold metallo-hydrolase [Gammaproteobacteria bacterium]|jgi:L-ascorbate metabolism protein UlaG (beta-lactamase superfamily)|nr:MBL fold metallo-hydrolase [Gammaproteobacteria bacterium]
MFGRVLRQLSLVIALLLTLVIAAPASAVEMTFYGNQHFKFVSDEGKVILINPWVKGNKDAPMTLDSYKKGDVDLILTTSGHGDDQGNAVEIAARTGATIFTVAELGGWMQSQIEKFGGSKKQIYRGAISGRYKVGNVAVQLIQAAHGTGISTGKEDHPAGYYGGPASGSVITFESGLRVLMAGSTGLSMELQLFGMRFQPHVALVPIAGRFMMHPDDAAFATKLLMTDNPNLKTVVPQHHRIKGRPSWMGTPAEFEAEIKKLGLKVNVLSPEVGKTYALSK